jgi:hydroxyquinol 1,2-dioxygenase
MHTLLDAPGYERLVTHLFDAQSPYLDSDAVFGVRNSLIIDFQPHAAGTAPDGKVMDRPFHSAAYDFTLVPKA